MKKVISPKSSCLMKRYKIGYTEGLNDLITFIQTSDKTVTYSALTEYARDYDIYTDLYMNLNLIDRIMLERNKDLLQSKNREIKKAE